MPTPHKHAEVIRAYADGAQIEVKRDGGNWIATPRPDFDEDLEYRVKPDAPKWPQTTMTDDEIMIAMDYSSKSDGGPWRAIANRAISHACESGALVPADKVREIEAKARAEGKREGLHPVSVIQAVVNHLRLGDIDGETIQIILLKAAEL